MTRFLSFIFIILALHAGVAMAAPKKILDVQVIKSAGGIEAWLVEDKTVPVISIDFSFEGGLVYDPEDKPGLANLASKLLDEGAGEMNSQEFQGKLSDNAISMSFTAGRDAFYGSMKTLKANKETAFGLLSLALSKPRFDADAVLRMKNAVASGIRRDMGEPSWLSARTFNAMMFGDHFYGRPGAGDLESMRTITRDDLEEFVHEQFARNVLKVSIAGDITRAEAEQALDRIFGPLPANAEPVDVADVKPLNPGKTILLPLDIPQTFVIAGEDSIRRDDPDWHAALIMNYILGGDSFDARLMNEIREKRGLTYGVYSGLSSMNHAALLQVNMSASNDKAAQAIQLMKDQFNILAQKGPTAQELADAKAYINGSILLDLTSTNDISSALASLQRDHQSPDYINQRAALIDAVTLDDVRRVAQKILKADSLMVVLVGKPDGINPDILLDKAPGIREPRK